MARSIRRIEEAIDRWNHEPPSKWQKRSFDFPNILRAEIDKSATLRAATSGILRILENTANEQSEFVWQGKIKICYYSGDMENPEEGLPARDRRIQMQQLASMIRYTEPYLIFSLPEIVSPESEARILHSHEKQLELSGSIIRSRFVFLQLRKGWEQSQSAQKEAELAKELGIDIIIDDSNVYSSYIPDKPDFH